MAWRCWKSRPARSRNFPNTGVGKSIGVKRNAVEQDWSVARHTSPPIGLAGLITDAPDVDFEITFGKLSGAGLFTVNRPAIPLCDGLPVFFGSHCHLTQLC